MMLQLYLRADQPDVPMLRVVDSDGEIQLDATVQQLLFFAVWHPKIPDREPKFTHLWTCAVLNDIEYEHGRQTVSFKQKILIEP